MQFCSISYPEEYSHNLEKFRAIVTAGEKNEQVLDLTAELLEICPANYTVWYYRRLTLEALRINDTTATFRNELEHFLNDFTIENKKNYQIWNHRQFVVDQLDDSQGEIEFLDAILALDAKNYHAWTYRQWLIKRYDLWEQELEYVERLLQSDIRNNSAWNQRMFVLDNHYAPLSTDTLDREIQYAFKCISRTPNNESAWMFLRGLFGLRMEGDLSMRLENDQRVLDFALDMYARSEVKPSHLLLLLFDVYKSRNEHSNSLKMLSELQEVDPIRTNYWKYLEKSVPSD